MGFKDTNVPANDYFEAWLQINVLYVLLFFVNKLTISLTFLF